MKREVVCFCEHRFDTDPPEEVDLARSPELEEAILMGSFMTAKCPRCGRLLKPEYPTRVRDTGRGIDLFLIPEEDRRDFLHGILPYSTGGAARVVIGYAELVEGLQMARCGLDGRAVEVVKYYLLHRALQDYESADRETLDPVVGGRLAVLFVRPEGEALVFHVHGLKDDEVAVVKVPRARYEQVLAQLERKLREEPFDRLLQPPYVSINNLYRSAGLPAQGPSGPEGDGGEGGA